MRRIRRIGITFFLGLTLIAALAVVSSQPTEAKPPGGGGGGGGGGPKICECANIDLPVICDGGKIFINPCVAGCFGATGCVPYDGGGPPQ